MGAEIETLAKTKNAFQIGINYMKTNIMVSNGNFFF